MIPKKKLLIVIHNFEIGGVVTSLISLLNEFKDLYDIYIYAFSFTGSLANLVPYEIKIIDSVWPVKIWGLSQKRAREHSLAMALYRGFWAVFARLFSNTLPIWITQSFQKKLYGFDYAISFMHNGNKNEMYSGCYEFVLNRVEAKQKIAFLHCDYTRSGFASEKYPKLLKRFDKIAFVSCGCRDAFLNLYPNFNNKSYCVYNCCDFNRILARSKEEKITFNNNHLNIVISARLSSEKGIDRAIKVLIKLAQEGHKFCLHILGTGVEKPSFENTIRENNVDSFIVLYGEKENPYPYIAQADLLLVASYHEAAPMVIEEAKVLKIPVLTTETISAREQIKEGYEGIICENSEEGLYNSMKLILENPNEIKNFKEYLNQSVYSNENQVEQFIKLIIS